MPDVVGAERARSVVPRVLRRLAYYGAQSVTAPSGLRTGVRMQGSSFRVMAIVT